MGRSDLERLSKEELIELVLRLQRPQKTSRTSSKPPWTDRKEQRKRSKPGGVKPGHDGHSRILSATPDEVVEHRPERCSCCSAVLMVGLPGRRSASMSRLSCRRWHPTSPSIGTWRCAAQPAERGLSRPFQTPQRGRRLGRASMPWRPISRSSRPCPTSGYNAHLPFAYWRGLVEATNNA